jgi:acyl carrier protein
VDELIALIQEKMKIGQDLEPETALLSSGLIDSFHFVDLLSTLEDRYQVRIDPTELGVDNFDTPQQIYAFIDRQG